MPTLSQNHTHQTSDGYAALRTAILALGLGFSAVAQAAAQLPDAAGDNRAATWVKGRVLVMPRPGLSAAEFQRALAPHGGIAAGKLGTLDVYVVSLPGAASEQAVAAALGRNPHIKFAEVDGLVALSFTPNDPYYGSEWHLQMMNAPSAWDLSIGAGITVAVLDSGVDATHPDLQGQLVPGWNFSNNNSNTADVYGHGTKVAGVIGAIGSNSIGVTGMAWGARIMPIRVTDSTGYATWSGLASGLNWAADHGAKVANMSFATQASSSTQTAAQYFKNKGGVVMNSAGNYGVLDSTLPSDALVSVSATDSSDALASWSSFGPYVDVSAPGVGIWTTTMGGGYGAVSGTSFSSPLTAGVAALMMAANPGLAPSQIVSLLKSTAVDRGTPGYDYYYGYGRVNAGAAVLAARQMSAGDTQPPTATISSPTGGSVSGIVPVNVSASDNIGVTRVDLIANGVLLATDTTAPYGFSWDTAALVGSSATLVARAYDAAGNTANSQTVTVTVTVATPPAPPAPDATAPTVTITSPGNGNSVRGVVTIGATAADNVGIASLSLYLDGVMVSTGNGSSSSYKWNTKKSAPGTHTIGATAKDASGNQATTSIQVRN